MRYKTYKNVIFGTYCVEMFNMTRLFLITLCVVTYVAITTTTAATESEACGGKPADVVFVLDSSASISNANYQKMLTFTKEIVNNFDIGPDKTRIGLITFSDTYYPKFDLGTYTTKEEILDQIGQIGKENGGTNTGDALSYIRTTAFNGPKERTDVPHIAIILTDGQSSDGDRTKSESVLAHQEGIVIFVIGIGYQVDENELSIMASKPVEEYKFEVDDFDALNSIKVKLSLRTCEVPPVTTPPPKLNENDILFGGMACAPRIPVTITFAADTADIGQSNGKFVLQFIQHISNRLAMDSQKMSISAVTNGCGNNPSVIIDSASNNDVINADLEAARAPTGNVKSIMRKMRLKLTDRQSRGLSPVGVLFITDAIDSNELKEAIKERKRARFQRVDIFVVVVGSRVDQRAAKLLTTNKNHFFFAEYFETLSELEGPILLEICSIG